MIVETEKVAVPYSVELFKEMVETSIYFKNNKLIVDIFIIVYQGILIFIVEIRLGVFMVDVIEVGEIV